MITLPQREIYHVIIPMKDLYTVLAIQKLGQLIKPTVNLTKGRRGNTTIKTRSELGTSPAISKIIRATH